MNKIKEYLTKMTNNEKPQNLFNFVSLNQPEGATQSPYNGPSKVARRAHPHSPPRTVLAHADGETGTMNKKK